MKRNVRSYLCLAIASFCLMLPAQGQTCSTEKVNHQDCTFTINRLYPVTFPTIQMARGKKIHVLLVNPLSFETATVDATGTTLLPGTDQGAALATAALPDLKGLSLSHLMLPAAPPAVAAFAAAGNPADEAVRRDLARMNNLLTQARTPVTTLFGHIQAVYAQLSQVLSPLPRPIPGSGVASTSPAAAPGTPSPWTDYPRWRPYLLCELVGGTECVSTAMPSFTDVLIELARLEQGLPATPPAAPPAHPLFDQAQFDALITITKADIALLPPGDPMTPDFNDGLRQLGEQENQMVSVLATLGVSLPGAQKDFQSYYQSIELATGAGVVAGPDGAPLPTDLGQIFDPISTSTVYPRFLGRQVAFSVNVVNQIATSLASVTTPTAKTAIATIIVLYADPRFESSAGAIFNFVHDRTFTNQTITTPVPGTSQVAGEIQIDETKTRPEVVPFVAGHWRIGDDFTIPLDHRRGAVYATAWVGLNPYNALPEYGAGPTFSWRSIMISALYDRTHDTRLATGSFVGQTLCVPNPPSGSTLPSCTSAPSAPTTQPFATNAFAVGISVRIPTVFASGPGGVSR